MNLKGQLSHNFEIGADPLGNIFCINHALEFMPKLLAEAQTKLETVERQLEDAKMEMIRLFAQEAGLAEKLEAFKEQATGTNKADMEKVKRKEETL